MSQALAEPRTTAEAEIDAVVRSVETVADQVVLLTLRAQDGTELPAWAPGAHIDLVLGEDLVRQYSLCGDPADRSQYQVAVLLEPESRGGSVAVHRLKTGDRITVRGPRNHFSLKPSTRYIFIAGGIGITPILPMIAEAEARGADWTLHYGGRSATSMAFTDLLAKYGDRVHLVPQDEQGLLDLTAILGTPAGGTLVYCCGPEPLLNAVERGCERWPVNSLHLERFTALDIDTSGDTAFELVLERSGKTLTVEADQTVLEVMRGAGIPVLSSCQEGTCGTCEQMVLEGEVDHRDSVLDDEEKAANDCMMVCVSRCKGPRLVLDA
ncbi:PDR/VanB family oxidoreductase [Nocardioides sp.]|jgi:ferredoxin-NADP reductase|uniref:PDR/VanB family oxidoreductase n=1 Tax=Nocardioides sp. TaxID=35761 RepID=UPI002C6AB526|nr:PDR/VanB family oxidoreductase [Nocardioides sp.]HVX54575.1 PDR/VanB family oxidoreductase [Nocardioides sp.]